jgi:fructan beta-fructosidase
MSRAARPLVSNRKLPVSSSLVDVTRPLVHFTPPTAWLNDPNGLVHLDGEYHAFYQHNPDADVWGPMHWGHAVSRDLVRWEHLPVALAPDALGTIFSGSAVVDEDDTAGFGAGAMVLVFTHHTEETERQSLAYSLDRGRTWTKYAGNPVLEDPAAGRDFRDPKVFRYCDQDGEDRWVMVVAAGGAVRFYRSSDLRSWTFLSSFGDGQPDGLGVFECPDLFELPIDGGQERAWVLAVGHLTGGPAGGSGTRYFVGSFDGERFCSADELTAPRWADHGADLYATHTWSDVPDGRRIWAGWLNNWLYADRIPSGGWRGGLSVPRTLGLTRDGESLLLTQWPVAELDAMSERLLLLEDVEPSVAIEALADVGGLHLDVTLDLELAVDVPGPVGLEVAVGPDGGIPIVYDPARREVIVDRRRSGDVSCDPAFAAEHAAPYETDGRLQLRVLLDGSSVEVFLGDGRVTLTDLIFPTPSSTGLVLLGGSGVRVRRLEVSRFTSPRIAP